MFLEPDEHIIIMEDDYSKFYNEQDIELLKSAGIKSVYLPRAMIYKNGRLDLVQYKYRTEKYFSAGMKVIIPFYYGNSNKSIKDVYKEITPFRCGKVQFVYALPEGGEFLWDSLLIDNFPQSDDEIIKSILEAQRLLIKQHGEIWIHFHNFLGVPKNWNNTHLPFVYQALRDEFPNNPIYSVQFAHFACGRSPTPVESQMKIKKYYEEFGIKSFVGSEYCEGLKINLDAAIEQNAYGFITAPVHSLQIKRHKSIEPWMVSNIQEANQRMREVWDDRNPLESHS